MRTDTLNRVQSLYQSEGIAHSRLKKGHNQILP